MMTDFRWMSSKMSNLNSWNSSEDKESVVSKDVGDKQNSSEKP